MQVTLDELDLYLMANLNPRLTGLPFVVWISPRGNAKHDVRVKVSSGPKAIPSEMASISVRPTVEVIEGEVKADDLALLKKWIELNKDVLIEFWDGDIAYTDEALSRIRGIETE